MPSNPYRCADFLERVRPGFALSVALHVGLFILLAYLLAFHPALQVPEPPIGTIIEVVAPPPPPPVKPIELEENPTFRPLKTKAIDTLTTKFPPLVLPSVDNNDNGSSQTTTTTEPSAPPVIIDPTPIFRGGLVYPERAGDMGRTGYVDFDFIIEPDGTVGDPRVVAEVPDGVGFAAAAKKAFPQWRFHPMMKDGHPIAAPAHIRVTFKLQ
jgi:TonB family protein